jgi:hypothetical protein
LTLVPARGIQDEIAKVLPMSSNAVLVQLPVVIMAPSSPIIAQVCRGFDAGDQRDRATRR